MPSYYDSTKKKPGTAKVKYEKGGEVKKQESRPGPGPDAPGEWVDYVNENWGILGKIATPRTTFTKWAVNKIKKKDKEEELTASQKEALQKVADEKWRKQVDKAPTTKTTMGDYAKGGKVKKMSEGGKVRGMGAATRGGNFSRNG